MILLAAKRASLEAWIRRLRFIHGGSLAVVGLLSCAIFGLVYTRNLHNWPYFIETSWLGSAFVVLVVSCSSVFSRTTLSQA